MGAKIINNFTKNKKVEVKTLLLLYHEMIHTIFWDLQGINSYNPGNTELPCGHNACRCLLSKEHANEQNI
jgi:hypothetical protein